MKDRPKMELVGMDGNIFAIMGRASRVLMKAGMSDDAREMVDRVQECGSYNEALNMVSRYVQTEISDDDPGVIEAEDISVDREFTFGEDGITAYVETGFDVERRFGIELVGDDSLDLYATVQPETGAFQAELSIHRADGKNEIYPVELLPGERKLIRDGMESVFKEISGKNMKELFDDWKAEYGDRQQKNPKKEMKKHQHER